MRRFSIAGKRIGSGAPTFVIAEAGVNHNGRLELALKLIDAAAKAGADAVKFQTFRAEEVATPSAPMATYQKKNTGRTASQVAMLRSLELPESYYPRLIRHCKKRGIIFLSTPHGGIRSINFLKKLRHSAYKIASPDLTNRPLIEHAARIGKPIILSTGMGNLGEIRDAMSWIKRIGNARIAVLQCTTDYPTMPSDVNLRAMRTIKRSLGVEVGFSDHTSGMEAAPLAVVLGASIIEKHFTLSRSMKGPDHAASLEPDELAEYVRRIRSVETYLGSPRKVPVASEKAIMRAVRKSIVASRLIKRGEKITLSALAFKRPALGLSPSVYKNVVGRRARKNIPPDALIRPHDYA